jgi:hypothetical protein
VKGNGAAPARASQTSVVPPTGAFKRPASSDSSTSRTPAAARTSTKIKAVGEDQIAANRRALGLSDVKISDMVKGLDKAAERAERQAQREEEKRKAGGKVAVNKAVLNDETGSRWSLKVKLGIAGAVALVALVGGIMFFIANHKSVDPKIAQRETHDRLVRYEKLYSPRMPPYSMEDTPTPEQFWERLTKFVEEDYQNELKTADKEKEMRKVVSPDVRANIKRLEGDRTMKDASGKVFALEKGPEDSVIVKTTHGPEDSVQIPIPRLKPQETKKTPKK